MLSWLPQPAKQLIAQITFVFLSWESVLERNRVPNSIEGQNRCPRRLLLLA